MHFQWKSQRLSLCQGSETHGPQGTRAACFHPPFSWESGARDEVGEGQRVCLVKLHSFLNTVVMPTRRNVERNRKENKINYKQGTQRHTHIISETQPPDTHTHTEAGTQPPDTHTHIHTTPTYTVIHTQKHRNGYTQTEMGTHTNTGPYIGLLLFQDLVVLAEGGQEDERRHVLETVDPLPPALDL